MTPLLLARWKRQAERGRELSVMQKMAIGALIVAASYLLVAAAEAFSGDGPRALAVAALLLRRSSRSASSTSCPTASASSRGWRRRSSARARSPPGTSRSSPAACWPVRSGGCGATSTTSPSSSCWRRSRRSRRSCSTSSIGATKRVLADAAERPDTDLTDVPEGSGEAAKCVRRLTR